jgi:hypothetical protein
MTGTEQMNDQTVEDASQSATPVMAQFLVLKQANPGSLLFVRMGDFYELFFEDAEVAAKLVEIGWKPGEPFQKAMLRHKLRRFLLERPEALRGPESGRHDRIRAALGVPENPEGYTL